MSERADPVEGKERMLPAARRDWVLACGARYWARTDEPVRRLPFATAPDAKAGGAMCSIVLPGWAEEFGVRGAILVDRSTVTVGEGPEWQRCDWIAAAWLHLTGAAERKQEDTSGPIQSYCFRLRNRDERRYDRAWVNRIFLFLRRWVEYETGVDASEILGSLPEAELILTHDVDAIEKTPEIRLKQGAFYAWNSVRSLSRGAFRGAAQNVRRGLRFVATRGDFLTFSDIRAREEAVGLRSLLHFYGGFPGWSRRSPSRILLDPAYDIRSKIMLRELAQFKEGGWTIGLHQSTRAWHDAGSMKLEKANLEMAAGQSVLSCRQHWLRFSWRETWKAQDLAGFRFDSTLGFNDRPGFRNGAALFFHPWDFTQQSPMSLVAGPMVFMDSHFYDYQQMSELDVADAMTGWLDEVMAVRGQATVNWHTHTITDAYGWGSGYDTLLRLLK